MFRRSTTTARSARPALAAVAPAGTTRLDDAGPEGPSSSAGSDARTTTGPTTGPATGPRHTRRAHRRQADDAAALRARLDRMHRRLAEVGSVQVKGHVHAIDTVAARRDPLTHPFAAPWADPWDAPQPGAAGEQAPARRSVTGPLSRPA